MPCPSTNSASAHGKSSSLSQDLGDVEFDDLAHPEIDDALGNLGALALKMGGEVVIIPTERMPTETGIAAIYRY
jgi:hypothetical protein